MLEKSQSDIQLKQVRVCAEIGVECLASNPEKRPDTKHIMSKLNKYNGNLDMLYETMDSLNRTLGDALNSAVFSLEDPS